MESIIGSSKNIRNTIKERLKELKLTQEQVIRDAKLEGIIIYKSNLSNYISNNKKYNLTEQQILFICTRYGISAGLQVTVIPYNEAECIKKVKLIFGKK